MDNSLLVYIGQPQCNLEQNALDLFLSQSKLLLLVQLQRILREILKHYFGFALGRVLFEVQKANDVGMIEIFKKISLF